MYIRKTKNKTHKKFSIDEKNKIVLLYLDKHIGVMDLVRMYDLAGDSQLYRWIHQYEKYGTCIDNRGCATKKDSPNKGRPKSMFKKDLEDCTKDELITMVQMLQDIKKCVAYLEKKKQNKNIK